MRKTVKGGYDDGYIRCPCFWGTVPSSLVRTLLHNQCCLQGMRVLDIGCGEGKNSVCLADKGATVDAIDVSIHAIHNARAYWGNVVGVNWAVGDVRQIEFDPIYDIVIAYGLFHCLTDRHEIGQVIGKLQRASVSGGYHVICAFNDRRQDLHDAHLGFDPCLLPHDTYISAYSTWSVLVQSDLSITESHPHNGIIHSHSVTRILARKMSK